MRPRTQAWQWATLRSSAACEASAAADGWRRKSALALADASRALAGACENEGDVFCEDFSELIGYIGRRACAGAAGNLF